MIRHQRNLVLCRHAATRTRRGTADRAAAGQRRPRRGPGLRPVARGCGWVALLALKSGDAASQQQIADQIGIRGATLTHHLSGMEERGLVVRTREVGDRRAQTVRLTERGESLFGALAGAAQEFDRRLRRGLGREDLARLNDLLGRLHENAGVSGARLPGDVTP
jgi:MarR family transcriptional regulator for hemolysin